MLVASQKAAVVLGFSVVGLQNLGIIAYDCIGSGKILSKFEAIFYPLCKYRTVVASDFYFFGKFTDTSLVKPRLI